jgi:pyrroloquinoline quinone biosynthesis protein D
VTATDGVCRLARGVRLRRDADGNAILLVPEGIVSLSESAEAALQLVDGTRTIEDVIAVLGERFEDEDGALGNDVRTLFDALAEHGFLLR